MTWRKVKRFFRAALEGVQCALGDERLFERIDRDYARSRARVLRSIKQTSEGKP